MGEAQSLCQCCKTLTFSAPSISPVVQLAGKPESHLTDKNVHNTTVLHSTIVIYMTVLRKPGARMMWSAYWLARLSAGRSAFRFLIGVWHYSQLPKLLDMHWGPKWLNGVLSPGLIRLEIIPLCSFENKNEWSCTSSPVQTPLNLT
jgi:hypothetical protein